MADKKKPFRYLPMDIGRICCFFFPLIYRTKTYGLSGERDRKKIEGGALLAANHTSFSDPVIMGSSFWYRRMFYLVAEVVMKGKLRGFLLGKAGAIKIDRNISDIEAVRKCVKVLKDGKTLTLFPQGGIKRDEEDVESVKTGAVLIAMQADVPIIPVFFRKRKHWYSRQVLVKGNPLKCSDCCSKKFPSVEELNGIAEELRRRMNECEEVYDRITGDGK